MTDVTGGPDPEWEMESNVEFDNWAQDQAAMDLEDHPPFIPGTLTAYCRRCAASGVGVCDDYPDCPAGRKGNKLCASQ